MKSTLAQSRGSAVQGPGMIADALQLGKPRITVLVAISTALGFAMGGPARFHWETLALLLAGTLLVGWGNNTLNQVLERDTDALMERTRERPLPAGRVRPETAGVAGILATLSGLAVLYLGTTPLAAGIALAVSLLYLLAYTPLKRVTTLNTLVGAVPGALPPVLGWTAHRGELGMEPLAMFLIMFVWQLPHFLPIAWLYRDDYRRAGLAMITVNDPKGGSTRRQLLLYTATLVLISLYPSLIGMAGTVYFAGALVLGMVFFTAALSMVLKLNDARAQLVLRVSVIYLPLLFGLLVYDSTVSQAILHSHP